MGGGLMQLVAYGAQDIYLTGNPQITFFKVVYRRHTNFSMECIQQTINGSPTASGNSSVTISRNGDLVGRMYVTNANGNVTDGSQMVSEVELEIGGQKIDKHYQEWNDVWNELSTPESKAEGLKAMQGAIGLVGSTGVGMAQVPLNFWFCRNPGLALPLIALQYHEVKVKFTWGSTAGNVTDVKVWADYIYLDTDERRRFAQVSHEYLIEQVQREQYTLAASTNSLKLNFNHPVKELIWTLDAGVTYTNAQLKLNGHDRFAAQEEEYFQLRQPYDHHTAIPKQNLPNINRNNNSSVFHIEGCDNTIIVSNVTSTLGNAATGTSVQFTQPANTILTSVAVHTTTATVNGGAGNYDLGFQIGTTEGGAEVATAPDHIIDAGTTTGNAQNSVTFGITPMSPLAGTNTSGLVTDNHDDTTSAAYAGYTATDRTLFASMIQADHEEVNSCNVTTAGAYTFIIGYQYTAAVNIGCRTSKMTRSINVYSFALKPEEHQPSGTCNFSRIDTAKLELGNTSAISTARVYAVNYNVLRIMSGMGGLAYSN